MWAPDGAPEHGRPALAGSAPNASGLRGASHVRQCRTCGASADRHHSGAHPLVCHGSTQKVTFSARSEYSRRVILSCEAGRLQGGHYLVALAGESKWVRNVRAAGRRVVIGRQCCAARLVEVPPRQRAQVIRVYLLRWGRRAGSLGGGQRGTLLLRCRGGRAAGEYPGCRGAPIRCSGSSIPAMRGPARRRVGCRRLVGQSACPDGFVKGHQGRTVNGAPGR